MTNLPLTGYPWSPEHDAFLLAHRNHMTCRDMATAIGRTLEAVRKRLQKISRPGYGPLNKVRHRPVEATIQAAQTFAMRHRPGRMGWPRVETDMATALKTAGYLRD